MVVRGARRDKHQGKRRASLACAFSSNPTEGSSKAERRRGEGRVNDGGSTPEQTGGRRAQRKLSRHTVQQVRHAAQVPSARLNAGWQAGLLTCTRML